MANVNNKPTQTNTPVTADTNAWDYLNEGADITEQNLDQRGFRRIQHMNENTAYHRGTSIVMGGYGIKNEDGTAVEIGKTETIKHRGGRETKMAVAPQIEVALIGFSQRYFVAEYDDPADPSKRVNMFVPNYIRPEDLPTPGGRCRSGISLFVVLKVDEARELYELGFKGFNTDDAAKCISQAKGFANTVALSIGTKLNRAVKLHTFGLWLPLGVGESKMVGQGDNQSPVTPPAWKIDAASDLTPRMVTKDDYIKFIELRKQLDDYLATGKYSGGTVQRPQLASGVAAHALAIPEYTGQPL